MTTIIEVLEQETDEAADARREKAKWVNYIPASEKRPLDEFVDLEAVKNEFEPVDISADKNGEMVKYITRTTNSKFNRLIDEADIVQYLHETRFDNGQLVDFDEKRRAKEKFEMANPQ